MEFPQAGILRRVRAFLKALDNFLLPRSPLDLQASMELPLSSLVLGFRVRAP